MIVNTPGIVLHSMKYSETGIIARIYTGKLGLQSYLVPGVRKNKSRIKKNLFQTLSVLDMVVYHKERDGLQRIREISCQNPYKSIHYDINKSAIAIFLAEIMKHSLKNQEANPQLYEFMQHALFYLDNTTERIAEFHLVFLLKLSKYLGFQPRNNFDASFCYFNLQEGVFQNRPAHAGMYLSKTLSKYFFHLANADLLQSESIIIPKENRRELLQKIVDYYRYHLEGMPEIKSTAILETVLHA